MASVTTPTNHHGIAEREADHSPNSEDTELSPSTRRAIAVTLSLAALLLASIGGWLWYGAQGYQNLGPLR